MEHAETPFSSFFGTGRLHVFAFGPREEDNLLVIAADPLGAGCLVRVQSACYTAEIFRSTDCDCHEQLERSLERIFAEGGLLVYQLCDGRGAGLLTKIRGLNLGATEGLNTYEAYRRLGVEPDPRDYGRVAEAIRHFGVQTLRLLTNNPRKLDGLREGGFDVQREPLEIPATEANREYQRTKRDHLGHLMSHLGDR